MEGQGEVIIVDLEGGVGFAKNTPLIAVGPRDEDRRVIGVSSLPESLSVSRMIFKLDSGADTHLREDAN